MSYEEARSTFSRFKLQATVTVAVTLERNKGEGRRGASGAPGTVRLALLGTFLMEAHEFQLEL